MLIDIFFIVSVVAGSLVILKGITYLINENTSGILALLLIGAIVTVILYLWIGLACGDQLITSLPLKLYVSLLIISTALGVTLIKLLNRVLTGSLKTNFNLGITIDRKLRNSIKNKINVIRKARIDKRSYNNLKSTSGKLSMTKGDSGELTLDDK